MMFNQTTTRFRSKEEEMFNAWLNELATVLPSEHVRWAYETYTFQLLDPCTYQEVVKLKTKTKVVERHLYQGTEYTPDFCVTCHGSRGMAVLQKLFPKACVQMRGNYHRAYFDVKGTFNPHQKDPRYFSLIQKLTYHVHGIWVEKVIPQHLFKKSFCPEEYRWMKNRNKPTLTKLGKECKTAKEFIDSIKIPEYLLV